MEGAAPFKTAINTAATHSGWDGECVGGDGVTARPHASGTQQQGENSYVLAGPLPVCCLSKTKVIVNEALPIPAICKRCGTLSPDLNITDRRGIARLMYCQVWDKKLAIGVTHARLHLRSPSPPPAMTRHFGHDGVVSFNVLVMRNRAGLKYMSQGFNLVTSGSAPAFARGNVGQALGRQVGCSKLHCPDKITPCPSPWCLS